VTWTFQLAARDGQPLGELRNATSRSLNFPLNRTPRLTFSVDAAHPHATKFLDTDLILVKAYDDTTGEKTLRFCGPVTGYQKVRNSDGGKLAVVCAGVQWRLDRRLLGQSPTGTTFGTSSVTRLDRGEMMGRAIDALNSGENINIFTQADDTGIRRGTITPSSTTFVSDWRYKPSSEAFVELASTLDGPDWEIVPVEPAHDATGVQIGALNVSAAIGSLKPNAVFEFGTGRYNVAEWNDIGDATTIADRAVNLPPGFPDNATDDVVAWQDDVQRAARGLYEVVVSSDVQTADLRTKLVQSTVAVRGRPRRVIAFSPVAEDSSLPIEQRRVPRLFTDYIVGDTIPFRAVEHFPVYDVGGTVVDTVGHKTADELMRVFGATIDLDDNGTASTTLVLQNDL
jgi:hypothetical protein